jgi:hypothetical protein
MHLKDVLGDVDTDGANLHVDDPLIPTLAISDSCCGCGIPSG